MVEHGELAGTRVAILVQNLPVPFDRRVWQEATALKEAGASVHVICPGDDKYPSGEFVIDGIEIHRYAAPPEAVGAVGYLREYAVALFSMWRILRRLSALGRFDVVHFCNPPDLLFLTALPERRRGTALIFDQHDLGPELVRAKHLPMSRVFEGVARVAERLTYASASHVISTNESYRRVALTRGRKTDKEVTVVRSAPADSWIQPGESTKKWHRGRKYLVGYVGVIGRQEGIEYLLGALRELIGARQIDVQLCLVGSGPDMSRLKELTSEMNLSAHVTFLGRVSDEELRSVVQNSDVCVNPDEVNELNNLSTMNKIMEYMALGKPIVQFDVVEGRFSAGDASLYAAANDATSLADKIQDVLEDLTLARRMSEFGARRFAAQLSWERQIPALIDAYKKTMASASVSAKRARRTAAS